MRSRRFLTLLQTLFAAVIFAIGVHVGADAEAQTQTIPTSSLQAWPAYIFQAASAAPATVQYRFTNAFFDDGGDDEGELFGDAFNPENTFPVQIWRDVFNNFDLFGSWTTVDHLIIRQDSDDLVDFSSAFTTSATLVDFLSFPFFDLRFGGEGNIEITDAKQTIPAPLTPVVINPNDSVAEASDIRDLNPYLNQSPFDQTMVSKIEHYLHPFKLSAKIPFSRSDVTNMQAGEVISYTTSGQVAFGGSLGWKVLPSHIIDIGVSATVETHLNGSFEVSVMKEDERYAKVRVSRLKGRGQSLEVNAGAQFSNLLQGFFLFSKASVADQLMDEVAEQVIPFEFDISGQKNQEISVGYRYDLNSDNGRDCYHRAVLGSLVSSETAANAEAGDANPSVTKLYDAVTADNTHSHSIGINLSFFFGRSSTSSKQVLNTEIQMPDGTSHVFSSIEDQNHDAYDISGTDQETSQKLTVSVNQTLFSAGKDGGVLLAMENIINDGKTEGKKLNDYAFQIENYFSNLNLFPAFPDYSPDPKNLRKFKKTSYGQTSFYYGFSAKDAGISAFLHADEKQTVALAGTLGIRMDVPAILAARAAFDSRDAQKTNAALSYLFNDKKHQSNYPKLLMERVDSSLYDVYLVGQSSVFGSIQYRGHQLLTMEQMMNESADPSGQPTTTTHDSENTAAQIQDLHTEVNANRQVVLHFKLSSSPEYVYFHFTPMSPTAQQNKENVDLIVYNRAGRFVAGDNVIVLDSKSSDNLVHRLTAQLTANEMVMVTLGYTPDENSWGYGASTQFQTTSAY